MGKANPAATLAGREMHCVVSPAHGALNAAQLAEWILRDRLPVRMLLQLHKLLSDNVPGH
jgi:hypothetical protein